MVIGATEPEFRQLKLRKTAQYGSMPECGAVLAVQMRTDFPSDCRSYWTANLALGSQTRPLRLICASASPTLLPRCIGGAVHFNDRGEEGVQPLGMGWTPLHNSIYNG